MHSGKHLLFKLVTQTHRKVQTRTNYSKLNKSGFITLNFKKHILNMQQPSENKESSRATCLQAPASALATKSPVVTQEPVPANNSPAITQEPELTEKLGNPTAGIASSSALSSSQKVTWEAIVASEPKVAASKGTKPSPEVIAQIRKYRTERNAFLATLTQMQRDALVGAKPTADREKQQEAQRLARDAAQLEALRKFAIPNHPLVDIGANLQSRNSKSAIERLLIRAEAGGTQYVVLTGCSVKGSKEGIATCKWWLNKKGTKHSVRVYATVGVHPHDAKTLCEMEGKKVKIIESKLDELRKLSSDPFCVSLGECGLDYDRMFSTKEQQLAAFDTQVALAVELNKPLFVHLRERDADKGPALGAYTDAAEILSRYPTLKPERVCVHCFTGDSTDLASLVGQGYCIGLTGFVGMAKRAAANGTLEALAKSDSIPLNRLMIETDAPFMTPDRKWLANDIGVKGKNEPAALAAVCRAVAAALSMDVDRVAQETTRNAFRFFDFDGADSRINAFVQTQ